MKNNITAANDAGDGPDSAEAQAVVG